VGGDRGDGGGVGCVGDSTMDARQMSFRHNDAAGASNAAGASKRSSIAVGGCAKESVAVGGCANGSVFASTAPPMSSSSPPCTMSRAINRLYY
jgi:hypothetical protein